MKLDEEHKTLALDCLRYSDTDIFQCIQKDHQRFVDAISEAKASARWDDVMYGFQWSFEVDHIANDADMIDLDIASILHEKGNLRHQFDFETVYEWQ